LLEGLHDLAPRVLGKNREGFTPEGTRGPGLKRGREQESGKSPANARVRTTPRERLKTRESLRALARREGRKKHRNFHGVRAGCHREPSRMYVFLTLARRPLATVRRLRPKPDKDVLEARVAGRAPNLKQDGNGSLSLPLRDELDRLPKGSRVAVRHRAMLAHGSGPTKRVHRT